MKSPTPRLRMFMLLCVVTHLSVPLAFANGKSVWVRGAVSAAKFVPHLDPHETFELQVIRSENNSLTGMVVITRKMSEKEPYHSAIDVEGVERNGEFWPYIRNEVSDDLDEEWQEIANKMPAGQLAKHRVEPHTLGLAVLVDLEVFRPFIGKKHYGRVLLPDGEAATFFLDNLTPPANIAITWSRARMGGDGELHPSDYESISLVPIEEQQAPINTYLYSGLYLAGVEGEENRVTGYFVCAGARAPSEEEKKGQDIDSISLWARLEVAHDYHEDWKPVAPSSSEKRAIKLATTPPVTLKNCAIQLDGFRPFIGKYRFGRVVLPSGASTVIQLFDLLPPEKELMARTDLIAKEEPGRRQNVTEKTQKSVRGASKIQDERVPIAFGSPPPR